MKTSKDSWKNLTIEQKLGLLIRGYRKRYPYTIKAASRASGINVGRLRDIEAGRRKPLKIEELKAIHTCCFLLPLMAFKHMFPDNINPFEYIEYDDNKKTKKSRKTKRKNKVKKT